MQKGAKVSTLPEIEFVIGQRLLKPDLACVRCNARINKVTVQCSKCNFPICSKNCSCPDDDILCQNLAKCPAKNLQIIGPLKFLLLKSSDPDFFKKLLELESHDEELKKSEHWSDYVECIIKPLQARIN